MTVIKGGGGGASSLIFLILDHFFNYKNLFIIKKWNYIPSLALVTKKRSIIAILTKNLIELKKNSFTFYRGLKNYFVYLKIYVIFDYHRKTE